MAIRALLVDGSERELDAKYGATVPEVVQSLTEDTLTGSAVPLQDVLVATADGGQLVYGDVTMLVDEALF